MTNPQPPDIGTDRQLFVDDFWIDQSTDVTRVLHSPDRREPVIEKEYPWEEGHVGGLTTAFDGEKYRMWYKCEDARVIGVAGVNYHRKAYAESEDGINWTKPFLRQEKFQGSMENNLFSPDPGVANIDANPDAKEDEKFKGFKVIGRREKSAIYAMASPDGITWHQMRDEPILTGWPFDTKNLFFWDKWTGQYRGYTKGVAGNDTSVDPATVKTVKGHEFIGGVRWIRTSTSEDFYNWTPLEDIDAGDTPLEHLYTNECWDYDRAPNTYLMFPSRYVAHRMPDPDWYDGTGVNDIAFMSSRDGVNFDRSFMEAFLRPGLDQRNWHERGIYFQHGIYQTSPTELSMYVQEHIKTPGTHVRRYTLRPDGFVSVNARYTGGEFVTRPFIFDGRELELNYSTSAVGTMRVEIQDDRGNVVTGFALEDCPEIFGDQIEGVVRWNSGGDVSRLAGKPVKLRFAINDADIYAFRFR